MIETIETGSPNLIGFKVTDKLHGDDYQRFVHTMEAILTAEGKVRLFVQYEYFPGWDVYAAWDDFKLNLAHYSDFERIAVVGDHKWKKLMTCFAKPFSQAEVRYFNTSEIDAAWKWLKDEEENRATEGHDRTLDEVPDNPDVLNCFRCNGL